MKKLFENGLVQRNTETKPYTYSITEKGKSKVDRCYFQSNNCIDYYRKYFELNCL